MNGDPPTFSLGLMNFNCLLVVFLLAMFIQPDWAAAIVSKCIKKQLDESPRIAPHPMSIATFIFQSPSLNSIHQPSRRKLSCLCLVFLSRTSLSESSKVRESTGRAIVNVLQTWTIRSTSRFAILERCVGRFPILKNWTMNSKSPFLRQLDNDPTEPVIKFRM